MAGSLDHQVGTVAETTYGTPVTVTRFHEILPDSTHSWDPRPVQGEGLRTGAQFARLGRRAAGTGRGAGELKVEATSKGQGTLLEWAMGNGTSTLVSGTTYQQLFTTAPPTSGLFPSRTIQYGVVEADASGTPDPYTYSGCMCTGWELSVEDGGLVQLSFSWDAYARATATALAAASYPTGLAVPFHFAQGALVIGGTLTAPTTTVLGSIAAGTTTANVRSLSLSVDNGMDVDRWVLGGRNQPRSGVREATLSLTTEYTGSTWRDYLVAQGAVPFLATFTSTESLSTGTAVLQICGTGVVNAGADANPSTETPTEEIELQLLTPSSGYPLYAALRTADTAL
jgi:hypothetical protein